MASPTIVRIGAWDPIASAFVPHPSCPTGAVFDINDGTTFSLVDSGSSRGDGLDLAEFEPSVYTSSNPRVTGERVWRRIYDKNRLVTASLAWMGTSYTTWIAAKNNLETLLEGITPQLPGVLQVQTTLSSTPVYFDIVEAHIYPPYGEIHWAQMQEDSVKVKFTCLPRIRLPRVTLQNLINNPGFEAPSGSGVLCFNDQFANNNAYAVQAGGALGVDTLSYNKAVQADQPLIYCRFNEPSGTTASDAMNSGVNGTLHGGVTLGVPGALMGDTDTAYTLNGSTGYITIPASVLPSGNNPFTFECWFKCASLPVASAYELMTMGPASPSGAQVYVNVTSSGTAQVTLNGVTGGVIASSNTFSTGAYHHVVATWNGVDLWIYLDGVGTGTTPGGTPNLQNTTLWIGIYSDTTTGPLNGQIDEVAVYGTCLSNARVNQHYIVGHSIYAAQAVSYSPTIYYRLNEKVGTTVYNILNPADTGTQGSYNNTPTLGVTGALSGDSDTAVTFAAASSQFVDFSGQIPVLVNGIISFSCWSKFAGAPGANQFIFDLGASPRANHQNFGVYLDSSRRYNLDVGGGSIIQSAAQATATYHHIVATWDGTYARLYIDGTQVGTGATPGAQNLSDNWGRLAVTTSGLNYYSGQIDEALFYQSTLTQAQITQLYTLGTNSSTATLASNTMTIPAAGRVQFGAPWMAIQTWQVRFRYFTSQTVNFDVSWFDANNTLAVQTTGTALSCIQTVAGAPTTISTTADTLVNGVDYWITVTAFPPAMSTNNGNAMFVRAQLAIDSNGAPGNQIALLNPTVAIYGVLQTQPQISVTGAALGLSSNQVYQFGPGGWNFLSYGQGLASLMYDQRTGNQYTGGPVASAAAAMVQAAPAGSTFAFLLKNADDTSTSTIQATAAPTKNNHVIGYSAYINSSWLGTGCTEYLIIYEYDINGNYLRQNWSAILTGNQSWTKLSGTVTTGASTAFIMLALVGSDSTSGSSNGTIWFDNVQMWDQTTTQAAMPYCEMRFPQSIAQIMVSGLVGNVPAPAIIAMTGYCASFPAATSITYWMGRRSSSSNANVLIAPTIFGDTQSLSSPAYGGVIYTFNAPSSNAGYDLGFKASDLIGSYHRYIRAAISAASPTTAGLQWKFVESSGLNTPTFLLPTVYPFSGTSWVIVDGGGVAVPVSAIGSRVDSTGLSVSAFLSISNATIASVSAAAYLPNDTETFVGTMTASSTNTNVFATVFWDGINQTATASIVTATYYPGIGWQPNYAGAINSYGPAQSGGYQFIPVCDSIPQVDPKLRTANAFGVNEWLLMITDSVSGSLMPCSVEISYEPTYMWPL